MAWDASPDAAAIGYRIYFGGASGVYTNSAVVGNVTNATITALTDGGTYYFAATAYNAAGEESPFSNETIYSVPSATTNQPPTLNALAAVTINEDAGAQSVALAGIGSGSVNESQTLTITAISSNTGLIPNPSVSYTSPNTTGSLAFTPVANGNGTATITVTVNDGQISNNTITRTFVVTVTAVNDVPTLAAISNVTINEDAGVQNVSLSGIGSGAANESQTLTLTAVSSNPGLIPNPSVNYTSGNSTGSLSFTPVANASGTATITVTVNDGQVANNAITRTFTVTVNPVNDAPTLSTIANLSIPQNSGLQTISLAGISTGAANESDTLSVSAVSSNPTLIPNPTVSYTSPNATGSLSFTPAANGNGSATITVTVNDGQAANNTITRTFTVTVTPVNQAPTLNALADVTINEDATAQTVALSGIGTGAANETQTLTVTAISSNPSLIPNPVVSYTSPNASGSLNFTPVANANGAATITVTVNDGQSTNNLIARSFTVTVNAVNDVPTLNALVDVGVPENASAQTVVLSGISSGAANESQTLTVTAVSSNPSVIPNPTVNYTSPNATGSLNFTPVANANGSTTITVTVNDGQAVNNVVTRSFTVNVSSVNNAPTLAALSNVTISEDAGAQTVPLSGITTGASNEVQTLTVTAVSSNPGLIPNPTVTYSSPSAIGSLSFTPVANSNGVATITVTVNDNQGVNNTVSQSFTVTVNAVNDAPTLDALSNLTINEDATAQSVPLSGISSGAANESQALTVTAVSSNPSLIPNPTVSYSSPSVGGSLSLTPVANANGTATITVTVNDGQAANNTVTRSFTVTVNAVNDSPTLNNLGPITIAENAGSQSVSLAGIGSGAANESQALTVTAVSSNPGLIPNPAVNYNSPNSTGSLSFAPTANSNGVATITVTVNDGQAANNTVSRSFDVTVTSVNSAPTISAIPNVTVVAGSNSVPATFTISDVETPAASLAVTASSSAPAILPVGNIVFGGSGSSRTVRVTPAVGQSGPVTVTVTVSDGAATATSQFLVTVQAPPSGASQLSVIKSGSGTVTPDLNSANLIIGQTYTVTATPADGYLFAGWSGSISSSAATLTFTMSAGLVLQANFVASPFTAASATYNGLFNEADEVRLNSAGAFNLFVGTTGDFSGWLQIGYARYALSGKLDSNLRATNTVTRWNGTPLSVEVLVGQGAQAGQITGRVTDGVWTSPLSGGRATGNGALSGNYTVVIPGLVGDANIPAGDGYATLVVADDGLASMNGSLADGTKFSQSAYLTADGDLPVYVSLYTGKGVILSWITFANLANSDLSGNLVWIKQAGASATSYPNGFTSDTKAVGSHFVSPAAQAKVLNLSGALVSFSGGELTANFNNVVSLNAGSQVVNLSPNDLTLNITTMSGYFSGQVQDPSSSIIRTFAGVVLQKPNVGYGFLNGTTASSRVVLAAP